MIDVKHTKAETQTDTDVEHYLHIYQQMAKILCGRT
jgi:hypothetical protein